MAGQRKSPHFSTSRHSRDTCTTRHSRLAISIDNKDSKIFSTLLTPYAIYRFATRFFPICARLFSNLRHVSTPRIKTQSIAINVPSSLLSPISHIAFLSLIYTLWHLFSTHSYNSAYRSLFISLSVIAWSP